MSTVQPPQERDLTIIDSTIAQVATIEPFTAAELAALAVFCNGELLSFAHANYGGQDIRADSPASRHAAKALVEMGILEPSQGAFVGSWYRFTREGVTRARATSRD